MEVKLGSEVSGYKTWIARQCKHPKCGEICYPSEDNYVIAEGNKAIIEWFCCRAHANDTLKTPIFLNMAKGKYHYDWVVPGVAYVTAEQALARARESQIDDMLRI